MTINRQDREVQNEPGGTESSGQIFWNAFRTGMRLGLRDMRQVLRGFWRVITFRDPDWPEGMNSTVILCTTLLTLALFVYFAAAGGQQ